MGYRKKHFSRDLINDCHLLPKAHPLQSSAGFTEGLSRHFILNLILKPGEKRSVKVKFTPVHNRTVSSLIIIRYGLGCECAVIFSTSVEVVTWFVSIWVCIFIYGYIFWLCPRHTMADESYFVIVFVAKDLNCAYCACMALKIKKTLAFLCGNIF